MAAPWVIDEVASILLKLSGAESSQGRVKVVPIPDGIYPVKHASFDKIRRDIGWEAETTLEEGLRRVVAKHFPEEVEVR